MKYFKLKNNSNDRFVGRYPQFEGWKSKGNLEDYEKSRIPIDKIIPPHFILSEKAFITDCLSASYIKANKFFVFHKKLLEFLESEFKHNYIFKWDITIDKNNSLIPNYNLVHIQDTIEKEIVDFNKTDFLKKKMGSWRDSFIPEPIALNSLETYKNEYKKSLQEGYILLSNNVTLDFGKTNDDLFRIDNTPPFSFANGYYVSERLKNAILDNGFTGLAFQELNTLKKINVII